MILSRPGGVNITGAAVHSDQEKGQEAGSESVKSKRLQ